jgi:hypothetical protein
MAPRSLTNWVVGVAVAAVPFLAGRPAYADEIVISGGGCSSAVHLVAREAHLSDVLARLARTLGFQLNFQTKNDPLVNVNAVRQPVDLVTGLAPSENVSIMQARDLRCPDRTRIVQVWILPNGHGALMSAAAPPIETEEQKRQAQAGIDMFLSAHGMPPSQNGQTPAR